MPPGTTPPKHHAGFTLIELLIGMGIFGVLTSVVIVAISPRSAIIAARDAERDIHTKSLYHSMIEYQIGNRDFPSSASIGIGESNAKQICALGVTTNVNCVQLDALVPDYLISIPKDPAESCIDYSGYTVHKDGALIKIIPLHTGKLSGDADVVVTPGCSAAASVGAVIE